MNSNAIFWPMIVQALVSLWMYFPMSRARIGAVVSGKAKAHDMRLPRQKEPEEIAKFGNAVSNQFELPVLFFVVCLAAHSAGFIDTALIVLTWLFAILKAAHSSIHITSNRLKFRFRLFAAALITAIAMWIWFAIKLALA